MDGSVFNKVNEKKVQMCDPVIILIVYIVSNMERLKGNALHK